MLDTLWSTIGDKFQIGLDIFTALSVIFAAWHYVRSSRKESEKQRSEIELQAEKDRNQRLVESGAKVLTEELGVIAKKFDRLVSEGEDIKKIFKLSRLDKKNNLDVQDVIKWSKRLFSSKEIQQLDKEFEQFRSIYSKNIDFLYQRRYRFLPVIKSINDNLINKINDTLEQVFTLHHTVVNSKYLWKEIYDLCQYMENAQDSTEFPNLDESTIEKIISIIADDDYKQFLNNILFTKEEIKEKFPEALEENKDFDLECYKINAYQLWRVLQDEEKKARLMLSLAHQSRGIINDVTTSYKTILVLLSACYSYILQQDKSKTLEEVIKEYENLYGLEDEIR